MSKITRSASTDLIHEFCQQLARYHLPVEVINQPSFALRTLHDTLAKGHGPLTVAERGQVQVIKHYYEALLSKKPTGSPQDLRPRATTCMLECAAALQVLGEDPTGNVSKAIKGAKRRVADSERRFKGKADVPRGYHNTWATPGASPELPA
jgi:hypothetical protein